MDPIKAILRQKEGMDIYKKFINESIEVHATVTYVGDGSENAELKASVDSFLKGKKEKYVIVVGYKTIEGTDENMVIAVSDKNMYYVGCDVLVRYIDHNGRKIAELADDEIFRSSDPVAKNWNRGVFRGVITLLKAIVRGL